MKILVISDSHGNIQNLKHVVGFGKKIGVKALIHAGDWNTLQSIEVVLHSNIPLYTVLGNADIDPKLKEELKTKSEKFSDEVLIFEIDGKKIGVTHIFNKFKEDLKKLDIIFTGHYHSQSDSTYRDKEGNSFKVVRPGALEKEINFVVYDTDTDKLSFFNDKV